MVRIGVSIINYRTADLTRNCLTSVLADIGDTDVRIVVVDNASGDGSAETIADWISTQPLGTPVTLVRSVTNTGFSGGHNQGIAVLDGCDFYLVLNSDALIRPGFFAAMRTAAVAHPRAGLIAPRIDTGEGGAQVSCFRFHTAASELIRGARLGPLTRILSRRVVPLDPPADPADIEWASFSCILLRAEMVTEIGPMDEGYFLYFEDAEYSLRARRAGWGIVQETAAVAVHFQGGSGPVKALSRAKKRLPPYYYASRTRFFRQSAGRLGPLMANMMWLLGRLIAQSRRLAGKPVPPPHASEYRDIWINFRRPLGSRRAPGDRV